MELDLKHIKADDGFFAICEVMAEYESARKRYPPMRSQHEGISIIREEYTELEREVFKQCRDLQKMRREAIQLAAMALTFIVDCCKETS